MDIPGDKLIDYRFLAIFCIADCTVSKSGVIFSVLVLIFFGPPTVILILEGRTASTLIFVFPGWTCPSTVKQGRSIEN